MEEQVEQGVALVAECYRLIRESVNEGVQFATVQIDNLISNPVSLIILLKFYQTRDDPVQRQFGLISLNRAIKNCWIQYPPESRSQFFNQLLQVVIKETVWVNRQILIDCIQNTMCEEFDDILFQFIQQAYMSGSDGYLEIALLLGHLIPASEDQISKYAPSIPFFTEMFVKGFESDQPEIRIAGFSFLCNSKLFTNAHFFEQSPAHWLKLIEILDVYVSNQKELHRLVSLFNYAIQERVFTGDFTALLMKLMSFFNVELDISTDVLLRLHTIIQSIITIYSSQLSESEVFIPLIQLHISLSFRLYQAEDSFTLSNAQFFESSFTSLCSTPNSIQILWEQCSQIATTNEGRFVFLRAVSSTFSNAPDFYLERIEPISELLEISIISNSQLLRDAAARTADELIKFYVFESDELSIKLAPIVIKACHEHVSPDLLLVCSRLLDTTKKTDDYFDQTFPFLMNLIVNSHADIQDAALQCLGSLARWSTIKINRDFPSLIGLLNEILKSTADHIAYLKSPAVDFVAKLSIAVGAPLNQFLIEIIPFLIENIESDDIALAVSCLSTIKTITATHYETMQNHLESIVPALMKHAEVDHSEEFMKNLNDPSNEDDLTETIFKIPGYSLQALATLFEFYPGPLANLYPFLMHCCEVHKLSHSQFCKSSIAIAISCIVKTFEVTSREAVHQFSVLLIQLLSTNLDMEVNFDVFGALSDIVGYQCYDAFEPSILEAIFGIICQFLTTDVVNSYRPNERQRDVYEGILEFLKNFIISAYTMAPKFLVNIINQFVIFLQEPVQRLRSYAIRFFGFLVASSSDSLSQETQQSTVLYAVQMAQNDNDYAPFVTLQQIALNNPGLLEPYADQMYKVFMEKLSMPFIKTENLLMLRDNCVSTFSIFANVLYRDQLNLQECAPIFLSALPLALDFEGRKPHYVTLLFEKMYDHLKDEFPDKFLRVLVIMFANPRSIIDEMNFEPSDLNSLVEILQDLIMLPNATQLCVTILENDHSKLAFLKDIIENGY